MPRNITALDGDHVNFECVATGNPQPIMAWQKDGGRLPSDGRYSVLESGTLRIHDVREEDEGSYKCQSFNIIGLIDTTATLKINDRGMNNWSHSILKLIVL